MSRLIDKLTRVKKAEPQPMGFAMSRGAVEKPRLQVLARVAAKNLEEVLDGLNKADAFVIQVGKPDDVEAIDKVCQMKDGAPGGGWLETAEPELLKKATDSACDFVVLPATSTLVAIQKDKMGRLLQIDPTWNEGLLRTVNDLPIDAVVASGQDNGALTLSQLMSIQRLAHMVGKPILVEISGGLGSDELQAVWDTGISGVIVEVVDKASAEKLAELLKLAEKLVLPSAHKKSRLTALLPSVQAETAAPKVEEEEEEEEEE